MYDRDYIDKLFAYAHLPVHLQHTSRPFYDLAFFIHTQLPNNPENTIALRLLLQAKDAAVRATVIGTYPPK